MLCCMLIMPGLAQLQTAKAQLLHLMCVCCCLCLVCCHTDPLPLAEMYTQYDTDELDLPLYDCHRGTSAEEGMHGHLNKLFKGGNYGVELGQVCAASRLFRVARVLLQFQHYSTCTAVQHTLPL